MARREIRKYVEKSDRPATLADIRDYVELRRADRKRLKAAMASDVRREGAPTITASVPSSTMLSASIDGAPIHDDEIGTVAAVPIPEAAMVARLNEAVLAGDDATADILRAGIRRARVARPAPDVRRDGASFFDRRADSTKATASDVVVREAMTTRKLSGAMVDHASKVEMLMPGVLTAVARGKGDTRRIEYEISPLAGDRTFTGGTPYAYGYALGWEYVARECMGTPFEATVMKRMVDDPRGRGFQPCLSDRDDASQLAREATADRIAMWFAREDTTAHLSCVCARCKGVTPLFPNGPVAWSAPRDKRCGDCEGCDIETDPNKWNTRLCVAPVSAIDHVSLRGLTNRAVRATVAEYMRERLRRTIRNMPTGDDLLRIADGMPVRVSDVLDTLPPRVASILSTVLAVSVITGSDVTSGAVGGRGALSKEAGTSIAIITGHVTRDESGEIIDATPMQRKLALADIRAMLPARGAPFTSDDDVDACWCRWDVRTGRKVYRCAGHWGGTYRWLEYDAARVWATDGDTVLLRDVPSVGGRAPSGGNVTTVGTPSDDGNQWCACDRC